MAAALCGLMIGCGGGSISIDQLGDSVIGGFCDRLQRCGAVASHDVCVGLYKQFLDYTTVTATVKAGTAKYDGEKAQACIDALGGASCDPSAQDERVTPQACKDAIKGTVADGGACKNGNECVSGSCSLTTCTMACCPGTCNPTAPTAVAIGQSCSTAPCVDGAYCNNGTCAALAAAGTACTGDGMCAYGTVCAGATGATTCTATPKAGDACLTHNGNADCVLDGLTCDTTNHCIALLDSGKTCDPQIQDCKFDLECDPTAKTCGALPANGAACIGLCAPGNYCQVDTTGAPTTCAPLKANGTACQSGGECSSGNCDSTSGNCAARVACT